MNVRKRRILAILLAAMLLMLCACSADVQPTQEQQPAAQEKQEALAEPMEEAPAEDIEQPPAQPEAPEQSAEAEPAEDAPAQEQAETVQAEAPDEAPGCTISISCAAILEHLDELNPEKAELVPADGWILQPVRVGFTEGQSAFDVLLDTVKANAIHMEYQNTPAYKSAYIEGIGNLYEFDCGELSGWMYSVNDWFPNYGCSSYAVQDGDVIAWVYTCDLGSDVGGAGVQQNGT